MNYGLTSGDIISSFSGALSGDFSEYLSTGPQIIENEIDLQSAKLDMIMPKFVVDTFHTVTNEILYPDSNYIVTPGLSVSEIKWFKIYDPTDCTEQSCNSDSSLTYTDNGDGTYTLTGTSPVLAKYTVDRDSVVDESIKCILRDMTCCSLGRKLFPSGQDTWNVVSYYCDSAKEAIELIKNNKRWLPSSMKKMEFHRSIFASINVLRG